MQDDCHVLDMKTIYEKASDVSGVGPAWVEIGAVPPLGSGGPILYGSIKDQEGTKEWLTTRLLSHLVHCSGEGATLSGKGRVTIEEDCLGKPVLSWANGSVPAISFSHGKGQTWAAVAWSSGIGIDTAFHEEFHGDYPLERAFRSTEINQGLDLCRGNLHDACALLWSLKEAAVKAMGWGFNLLDPLEVEIGTPFPWHGGLLFHVSAGRILPAWARREGRAWLAVALLA